MPLTELTFAFRQPKFPVICDFGDRLEAARSPRGLLRVLSTREYAAKTRIRMIDRTAAEWLFFPDMAIVSPSFPPRTRRKREIIELFNSSPNAKALGGIYLERWLNNRTVERIVTELAVLVEASQPRLSPTACAS